MPSEMQSLLLLLLSSITTKVTKATFSTKVTKATFFTTKCALLLLLFLSSTKVTLTDDYSDIPSVKYNLQLGDLTIKTELSTTNTNNSSGETVRT